MVTVYGSYLESPTAWLVLGGHCRGAKAGQRVGIAVAGFATTQNICLGIGSETEGGAVADGVRLQSRMRKYNVQSSTTSRGKGNKRPLCRTVGIPIQKTGRDQFLSCHSVVKEGVYSRGLQLRLIGRTW